jgi:primosomal protein N''
MAQTTILQQAGARGANVEALANRVMAQPEAVAELVAALQIEQSEDKPAILRFVQGQLNNPRKQVARKAERFLREH